MKIYLDTSSLIKLYHSEQGTEELDKLFEEYEIEGIFLSDMARVEFNSAIYKKARTKDVTEKIADELIKSFEFDFGHFTFVAVDAELVEKAISLLHKYGLLGLRTLDSFQLASMLVVKDQIAFAITADQLLNSLIKSEGMMTIN